MSEIEQRARQMLAVEFDARDLVEPARELRSGASISSMEPGFAASVAAVIAALTPPEGFVLVPVEPTEAIGDAPRYIAGEWSRRNWEAAVEDMLWLAACPEVP